MSWRDGSALYLREDDLRSEEGRQLFPAGVVAALLEVPPGHTPEEMTILATDIRTGKPIALRKRPEPWDLPVVFAVWLSLSLPGLFEAVRIYRLVKQEPVRDELGRGLHNRHGINYPPTEFDVSEAGKVHSWAEELWFSDGRVTSNFPIHFFDSPMPLWPTFGINLGTHPPGFAFAGRLIAAGLGSETRPDEGAEVEHVRLPRLDRGHGAELARHRADAHAGLPGRVAWVRQSSDEGGANLFMSNATIASLALRGVVAGARPRRRFSYAPYRERNQWIRLRVRLGCRPRYSRRWASTTDSHR